MVSHSDSSNNSKRNVILNEIIHHFTTLLARFRLLGLAMTADIEAGAYDILEPNRLEGRDYDWNTAVDECVHQVWVIKKGSQTAAMTEPRQQFLKFMQQTQGFAMDMNKDYPKPLAVRVR